MNHSIFLGFFVLITLCVALNLAFECGEVKASRGLVANGKKSFKGEWPWLVSLHKEIPGQPEKFFCGASLVNEWTLVSAGHCIRDVRVPVSSIRAHLGHFDITDKNELNWVKRNISVALVHEYYQFGGVDAESDIAVLIMEHPVNFTRYIQPICLPRPSDSPIDQFGIVVGYGKDHEYSETQPIPLYAELRTVNSGQCIKSHHNGPLTVSIFNSFCAKSNQSVPCVGDSGGPFMIRSGQIWTLFGVVSYAFNSYCDAEDYAIFVEVPKFVDWIFNSFDFFTCGSKKIPGFKYCDGVRDCEDGSDEEKCVGGTVENKDEFGRVLLTFTPSTAVNEENFGILSARNEKARGKSLDVKDVKMM